MQFSTLSILAVALAQYAAATTHNVMVGESGLVFQPDSVTAAMGDMVMFEFYPGDHSVAQSTFAAPCMPAPGTPIYSGFISSSSGAAATTFTVTINSTDPIWLYCSQVSHCKAGMAMVINPPSSGDTLAAYKSAAVNAESQSPATVAGGTVGSGSSPSGSSMTTAGASTSVSMMSTGSGSATGSAATMSMTGSATTTASVASTSSAAAAAGLVMGQGVEWGVLGGLGVLALGFGGLLM